MHIDLTDEIIARRLGALDREPAEAPYDWAEFQRRRLRATVPGSSGRNRSAVLGIAAALIGAAFVVLRSSHLHTTSLAPPDTVPHADPAVTAAAVPLATVAASDRVSQQRTRAIEVWLAGLPHDPAVVRVGTHVAVTSLQDQIAALDELMSAERIADAGPSRIGDLERRRAQLVSSLAQLRYAELLASAGP